MKQEKKEYTITKRIAKQGENAIIVIPSFLREALKPKTVVELRIKILGGENEQ